MNMNLHDIEYLHEYEDWKKRRNLSREQQDFAGRSAFAKNEVAESEREVADNFDSTISNSARLAGIDRNHKFERQKRRKDEAFEFGKTETREVQAKIIPINADIRPEFKFLPDQVSYSGRRFKSISGYIIDALKFAAIVHLNSIKYQW